MHFPVYERKRNFLVCFDQYFRERMTEIAHTHRGKEREREKNTRHISDYFLKYI